MREGRAGGWPRPLAALNMDRGLVLVAQPAPVPRPLTGSRGAPGPRAAAAVLLTGRNSGKLLKYAGAADGKVE